MKTEMFILGKLFHYISNNNFCITPTTLCMIQIDILTGGSSLGQVVSTWVWGCDDTGFPCDAYFY